MLFDSWSGLARVLASGSVAYLGLILTLRYSGKRTLAKLNAFDLVVTVALGSTLATIILSKDVALAEGLLALATLVLLQYLIAWLSVRSEWFRGVVKSEPSLLLHDGHFLDGVMRRQRLTRDEVMASIRASGVADAKDVAAVILETDGSISVVRKPEASPQISTFDVLRERSRPPEPNPPPVPRSPRSAPGSHPG